MVAQQTHNLQAAGSSPAPAPKNIIIMKTIFSTFIFLALLAIGAPAQKPTWARPGETQYTTETYSPFDGPSEWANGQTTWYWNSTEVGPVGSNLLVGYKIKTSFGARVVFGSIVVNTSALKVDAKPDQLLNDLIAELGKAGLLEGLKGLDRPERASISIISWEPIREGFVYSTEQRFTPSTKE